MSARRRMARDSIRAETDQLLDYERLIGDANLLLTVVISQEPIGPAPFSGPVRPASTRAWSWMPTHERQSVGQ